MDKLTATECQQMAIAQRSLVNYNRWIAKANKENKAVVKWFVNRAREARNAAIYYESQGKTR